MLGVDNFYQLFINVLICIKVDLDKSVWFFVISDASETS